MVSLTKHDLDNPSYAPRYTYSWRRTNGDGPQIGNPDRNELNRHEGYEVIDFIDTLPFILSDDKTSKLKAERLIRQGLPSNIRSHAKVTEWLRYNW